MNVGTVLIALAAGFLLAALVEKLYVKFLARRLVFETEEALDYVTRNG